MKSILKFIHVLIGVAVFLAIGYGIQNLDNISISNEMSLATAISSTPSADTKEEIDTSENVGNTTVSNETNTDDNLTVTDDEKPVVADSATNPSTDSETQSDETENDPLTKTDENTNVEDIIVDAIEKAPEFNYDMEAIDPHTFDHLDDMIEIIKEYTESPHSDFKSLYNKLYTRNYMHFEKEISKKNEDIHDFILSSLNQLEESDESMIDSSSSTLKIIEEILINLKNLE